jgi:hypothetical protein
MTELEDKLKRLAIAILNYLVYKTTKNQKDFEKLIRQIEELLK